MRIVILKLDVKTENPVKVNLLCRSIYIMNPEKANEIVIWLKNHISKRDKNTFCNPVWISYKFSFVKKIWHYLDCLLVFKSLSTYSNFESHKPVTFSYACQCSKLWLLYFYTKLYSCNKERKTWSFKFLLIS